MIRKLTLAVGFGAGYVLGARAGKERYAQIESKVRELMGQPAVQDLTQNVTSTASSAADRAKAKANETVETVSDKVGQATDKAQEKAGQATGSGSAASTGTGDVVVDLGTGPVVGATASGTAPDVV